VETAGVEEEDISGFQADWYSGFEQRLVFGDVSSEKQCVVKAMAWGGGEVGGGKHLQAAVVRIFGAECDPDVDEVTVGE
jgi:hypothetical protein